jgi:hypothetical protein
LVITEASLLAASFPAVAPAVTLTAVSATAAYASGSAYCANADTVVEWHKDAVSSTATAMSAVVDAHGKVVNYIVGSLE